MEGKVMEDNHFQEQGFFVYMILKLFVRPAKRWQAMGKRGEGLGGMGFGG